MKARFPIIPHASKWIIGSIIFMIACVTVFVMNFRPSIQFTGGAQVKVQGQLDASAVSVIEGIDGVSQVGLNTEVINGSPYTTVLVQTENEDDAQLAEISRQVQQKLIDEKLITDKSSIAESSIVGPSVGSYLTRSARNTVIVGLILMAVYMVFSFSAVRQYIQPQVLAAIVIFTVLFDVIVPMGVYGVKMFLDATTQVDLIFVIALLTTMGYSVNDTIVVFDRIRENLNNLGTKVKDIGQVFEDSIWQTMRRSLGTSAATFVVILAMWLFGAGDLERFAFSMGVGVISGTFSSVFLAAPLAYLMIKYMKKSAKTK